MWQKVNKLKQGCIIVVWGKMGKGKTTLATSFAEEFDIDYQENTRFHSKEMVPDIDENGKAIMKEVLVPKLVHSLDDFKKLRARKWPSGTAFIIDEGQATINRRDWNSKKNKFFNILMSTGRVFNSYIFITMPFWKVLDSETKLYVDAMVEVKGFDPETGKTTYVPRFIHPGYDEPIYFRVRQRNGRLKKIKGCTQFAPSPGLFWAQKRKADLFKMAIPQDMITRDGSYRKPGETDEIKPPRLVALEHANEKAQKWYDKLVDRRDEFRWGASYSTTKLKRETLDSVSIVNRIIRLFIEEDRRKGG